MCSGRAGLCCWLCNSFVLWSRFVVLFSCVIFLYRLCCLILDHLLRYCLVFLCPLCCLILDCSLHCCFIFLCPLFYFVFLCPLYCLFLCPLYYSFLCLRWHFILCLIQLQLSLHLQLLEHLNKPYQMSFWAINQLVLALQNLEPLCLFLILGLLPEKSNCKWLFHTAFIKSHPLTPNHIGKEVDLSFVEFGYLAPVKLNRL